MNDKSANLSPLQQHIRRLRVIYELGTADAIRMATRGVDTVYEGIEQEIFSDRLDLYFRRHAAHSTPSSITVFDKRIQLGNFPC